VYDWGTMDAVTALEPATSTRALAQPFVCLLAPGRPLGCPPLFRSPDAPALTLDRHSLA
jgi:hypothetical protein